jgi:hypothetical protein
MALIKASKDRAIPAATVLSADSAIRRLVHRRRQMTQRHSKNDSWWSHKTAEAGVTE